MFTIPTPSLLQRAQVISWLAFSLLISLLLAGCSATQLPTTAPAAGNTPTGTCPVSEPVLLTPPGDEAVMGTPQAEHYFVNADRSIWASAWASVDMDRPWRAGKEGNKVGWYRPAGETLEITGRRLDGPASPLQADVPCCYPTRFQASGLIFPTAGCWEVTAQAGESKLSFVVTVEP